MRIMIFSPSRMEQLDLSDRTPRVLDSQEIADNDNRPIHISGESQHGE